MVPVAVERELRTQSFDGFLEQFLVRHRSAPGHESGVAVDMSDCTFIEAPAAAMLCALAYYLSGGRRPVSVVPPASPDVRAYYGSCGLEQALAHGGVGARAGDLRATRTYLLPVCRVGNEHDVAAIGEFMYRSVSDVLGAPSAFASRSRSVFDALCENMVVHAEAGQGGWAAAQAHRRRDGRQFLRIGVVDIGLGIPTTMARRHPHLGEPSPATHCGAILEATEPGVTGAEAGGGIGLAQVRQLVADCQGTLHIRSLSGHVTIGIHGLMRKYVPFFPGTQLHVVLVE